MTLFCLHLSTNVKSARNFHCAGTSSCIVSIMQLYSHIYTVLLVDTIILIGGPGEIKHVNQDLKNQLLLPLTEQVFSCHLSCVSHVYDFRGIAVHFLWYIWNNNASIFLYHMEENAIRAMSKGKHFAITPSHVSIKEIICNTETHAVVFNIRCQNNHKYTNPKTTNIYDTKLNRHQKIN